MSGAGKLGYTALAALVAAGFVVGGGAIGHQRGYDKGYNSIANEYTTAVGQRDTAQKQLKTATEEKGKLEARVAGIPGELEAKEKEVEEKYKTEIEGYKTQIAQKDAENAKYKNGMERSNRLFQKVFGKALPKTQ